MTELTRPRFTRGRSVLLIGLAYLSGLLAALTVGYLVRGLHPLLVLLAADLAGTLVIFGWSAALNNSSVYDPYWSVAPLPIALYLAFGPSVPEVALARQIVVIALVAWWGSRLTYNWLRRWKGLHDEDWRYVDIRDKTGRYYWAASFLALHLLPTTVVYLGCLALLPALARGTEPFGVLDIMAIVVTAGAIVIETLADAQLHRFIQRRPGPTAIMSEGLWAFSRHPNYFGEILFWWGLFFFGLAASPAAFWWLLIGPLAMTALFVFISVPLIDRRMLRRRPGYADRIRKVSALIPWPPKE